MSRIAFAAGGGRWPVRDGNLVVSVTTQAEDEPAAEDTISFSVPTRFHAHPDCVAAALSTLAGKKYREIAFDFAISDEARQSIAGAYGVTVKPEGRPVPPRPPGTGLALNFSGGFDSLAALALAGRENLQLISMDFGGAFAREADYFRHFDTTIVTTDLRAKHFHRNDWRFMGAGAILLADHLDLGTIGFGTIFEASPWNFRPISAGQPPGADGPFAAAGVISTSWVRGLTEFGTAMVLLRHLPDEIVPSLRSLATPKSEKYSRKQLLIYVASEAMGLPVPDLGDLVPPKDKTAFGASYGVDFLAIYFAQYFGRELVDVIMTGFPDTPLMGEVLASDLGFYLKYNPNFLAHIPGAIRAGVLARMHEAGLEPFHERDYLSYAQVRSLLSAYHPIPD